MTPFGAIDQFVVLLVILALTALSNWAQKRAQSKEKSGPGRSPGPPRPRRAEQPSETPAAPEPSSATDWERELRRLFEGEATSSPPPAAPPPILIPSPPSPPPVPAQAKPSPPPLPRPAVRTEEGPDLQLVQLAESEEAYRKARQLHEQTAVRLRQATEQTKQHRPSTPSLHRHRAAQEVAAAKSLVRDPRTARQAIMASLILGPPRAFES